MRIDIRACRETLCLAIVGLFVAGCSWRPEGSGQEQGFRSVSPTEAMDLMKNRKDLIVIDVRSPDELKEGYIEGSVLVPFWEILQGKRALPKDRPILLVCAIGGRSYGVGQALSRNGWPEIYNLSGGIAEWKRCRLPLKY